MIRQKLAILFGLIVLIVFLGVAGLHLLEGWRWLDALYATVVTLGTVGYGDFAPRSDAGKVLIIFLILMGLGVISYAVVELTTFIVEGELRKMLRGRRVDTQIRRIRDHIVVCGAGRTGIWVVDEMIKNKVPFVIVDRDETLLQQAGLLRHPHVIGDATDDETLLKAGVDKARGLAAALATDEQNLFLVLTAKKLHPSLRCVSKCLKESSSGKMTHAGADAVVYPNRIGGLRIASELVRPHVVSFLDVMVRESKDFRFSEATVPPGSPHAGKTLGSLRLMDHVGLNVVAIRAGGERFIYNPPPDHRLNAGDTLVVISDPVRLEKMKTFLAG